jgi:hypothetical protein
VFFQINDMQLKPRLASAAAATAITSMMLISVGLGFPRLAAAAEPVVTLSADAAATKSESGS